jgi:urease accessory protein
MVGANLETMAADSRKARNGRPYVFTNLVTLAGVDAVVEWIEKSVLFVE